MFATSFIGCKFVAMGERPADVVQALEQRLFPEIVDVKVQRLLIGCGYCLFREINSRV